MKYSSATCVNLIMFKQVEIKRKRKANESQRKWKKIEQKWKNSNGSERKQAEAR